MFVFFNETSGSWKAAVLVAVFCIAALCGCGGSGNFLSDEGFISPNAPVLLNESPGSLTSDIHYIVMNLTPAQAESLLLKFKAQKPCSDFPPPVTPKQMPPTFTPNALWKPQILKKYWSGSFEKGTSSYPSNPKQYPYHCRYVFDIAKPGTVTLYFHAISFFN